MVDVKRILQMHQFSGTFPFDITEDRQLRPNVKLISYSISLVCSALFCLIYMSITEGLFNFENKPARTIVVQLSIIFETVVFLSRYLNLLISITTIKSNVKNYHKIEETFQEIGYRANHIPKENRPIRLLISFYTLFTFILMDFIVNYIILGNKNDSLLYWFYLLIVISFNRFVLFLTISIIHDLKFKFYAMNSLLLNIGSVYTCERFKPVKIFVRPSNCSPKTLMKSLKKLRYYCVKFSILHNDNLCPYILCYLAMNILSIIVHLYLLIIVLRTSKEKLEIVYPFAWCILKGISLLRLISIHCTTQEEANRTAIIVHNLLKYGDISDIINELQHFSHELLHKKFTYSVYGMFNIDYSLLTTVTGVVCTYLIILYQILGSKSANLAFEPTVLSTQYEDTMA